LRVGFVEWPEGLEPYGSEWRNVTNRLADAQLEMLITNELPFGPWIADRKPFDRETAQASIDAHAAGFDALAGLAIPAIVQIGFSTRLSLSKMAGHERSIRNNISPRSLAGMKRVGMNRTEMVSIRPMCLACVWASCCAPTRCSMSTPDIMGGKAPC
jgi:N-carbamoylputrescine amidase